MLHVALFEPEIPPNTGNIIRLCANSGAHLHLIEPLGFNLNEKQVRRAGLDYHDLTNVTLHQDYSAFIGWVAGRSLFACTTKARQHHDKVRFTDESVLLFGPESRGLPPDILSQLRSDQKIRIPMRPDSRSLNLSNATAIILYEAWRQLEYCGALSVD